MTVYYNENHRPQFHFSPKKNWMNDPNGMVFFNGKYHLFFQYHPGSSIWGPMHWGHAISKDLIHWEEMPIALFPDEHGAIFSGCAVVDWNNTSGFFDNEAGLVALYTSADHYPNSDRPRQRQSIAYSKDNGETWIKYEGNPILTDERITDYRDPKVFWHQETKRWVMVLATGQSITLYTSKNLIEWNMSSEFGSEAGSHQGVWECPDLFPLMVDEKSDSQKWVMLVSIGDNPEYKEGSRTQYFIGEFDGNTFINENSDDTILWLDYGMDNYAGVSWSDIPSIDGRRIYMGWMSNWRYANQVPTIGWRSAMTLPRELTLITGENGVKLIQQPVKEIENIKTNVTEHGELLIIEKEVTPGISIPSLCEIELEFELDKSTSFDVKIHHSTYEETTISYDFEKELVMLDRTKSGDNHFSESFPTIQYAPLQTNQKRFELRIIIDSSSLEVFANKGEVAITSLIFPHEAAKKLSISSHKGQTKVNKLKVAELSTIW